jgi:DNA-binding response OmpR family regulator
MRKPTNQCRILVVDDDIDQLHSLAFLLRAMGHDVRYAITGDAALKEASYFRPQLVFLDLGLPDMDGCEVARRLKDRAEIARIVAVTGRSTEEDFRQSLNAGCDEHLVKPVDPAVIAKVVEAIKS